ncbi:MAG: hypothetical protein JW828_10915 [Sedimentisphaerales bacterium]|nr:hypothetical protein [Sedimentisphaerales bacterium]
MMAFKHYIITCLNVGIYSHTMWRPGVRLPPAEWMEHRVRLFETFTLPSVRSQTCQNFIWLLLMDHRTPPRYKLWIESFRIPNLVAVYLTCRGLDNQAIAAAVMKQIEPGEYDLITTEVDSDDAIHKDMAGIIQRLYRPGPHIRQICFSRGILLDLNRREAFLMDYPFHVPTLIEPRASARSVYCWPNSELPAQSCERVSAHPCWIQVIHSQNVANTVENGPSRIIHRDRPIDLSTLHGFGLHPDIPRALPV